MKKLPIGVQTFADLRRGNHIYVDKTRDIYDIVDRGKYYFLARPRRFGKSLLLSTIEALYRGEQDLFEGLYIYDRWDWSKRAPIIYLDWSSIKHITVEEIERDVSKMLDQVAEAYQIEFKRDYTSSRFAELIEKLHKKTGNQVVILIDEYDNPTLDIVHQGAATYEKIRDFLHEFYRIIKACDQHIQLAFVTGISKFVKQSIYSAFNNLSDLTFHYRYPGICGYTQVELESYFSEYIEELALSESMTVSDTLAKIRNWYDGYSWDGKTFVYNPFSVLLLFDTQLYDAHWFETGTPSFLVRLIKDRNDLKYLIKPRIVRTMSFTSYDMQRPGMISLLWQAGYLTIKNREKTPPGEPPAYTVYIPNREVYEALMLHLVSGYAECSTEEIQTLRQEMLRQLYDLDDAGLEDSLRSLFAGIPYQLHIEKEAYFHSLLILWLKMLEIEVSAEVSTNVGRIDAVCRREGITIIIEVKYHPTHATDTQIEEALSQTRNRRYYEPYINDRIVLLSVIVEGREIKCKFEPLLFGRC
jgi:hypothetical protein